MAGLKPRSSQVYGITDMSHYAQLEKSFFFKVCCFIIAMFVAQKKWIGLLKESYIPKLLKFEI
jgi:hypothetical protein